MGDTNISVDTVPTLVSTKMPTAVPLAGTRFHPHFQRREPCKYSKHHRERIGVLFLIIVAVKVLRGNRDDERPGFMTGRPQRYEMVETMGLYWHFVDLVWVFIFAFFYLW